MSLLASERWIMDNLDTTGGADTVDTGTGDGGQETGAGAATGDPGKGKAGGARQAATAAETGGTGTSAATGDAGEGAKGAPEAWVPDDWRERIAGDDEKCLQSLRRYQSVDNWVKANRNLAQQIKTGMLRATLPENPSDAELAAFRKSWGIPDAP